MQVLRSCPSNPDSCLGVLKPEIDLTCCMHHSDSLIFILSNIKISIFSTMVLNEMLHV